MKNNAPFTTVNKISIGDKEYVISSHLRPCGKIGFHAHFLGKLTSWAHLFDGVEREVHRINKQHRVKGKCWVSKPFTSQSHAEVMCVAHSTENILYF